jgi:hypothetical protein
MKRLILIALLLAAAGYIFTSAAKTTKAATDARNNALAEVLSN